MRGVCPTEKKRLGELLVELNLISEEQCKEALLIQRKTSKRLGQIVVDEKMISEDDLAGAHPEVVARLQSLADRMRADLGDSTTQHQGAGLREPGRLEPGDPRFNWKPGEPLQLQAR